MNNKTFSFFTFGCKVNQYETQLMREQLQRNGFKELQKNSSYFIINGCVVTAKAQKKCHSLIKSLHQKNPQSQIIITGCYAYNLGQERFGQPMHSDWLRVIPPDKKIRIAEILLKNKSINLEKEFDQRITDFSQHVRAFVKIQDGCDNFCAYCIVPYIRGKSQSKKEEIILQEIDDLTHKGFKEIVLTGINLGMWGKDFKPAKELADLIEKINVMDVFFRLRLSSIELQCISNRLIDQFTKAKTKLCAHLHIPLQSGDTEVLKNMNRKYTGDKFIKKIQEIKKQIKGVGLTTDVLVGFPGETQTAFDHTQALIKKAEFLRVHIFPFSLRPGTKAAISPNQIESPVKNLRKKMIKKMAQKVSFNFRKKIQEQTVEVLFEKKEKGDWVGYCREYIKIRVKSGKNLKNVLENVKITQVTSTQTKGELVD
ncbi:MAG: tRNA (N(6)-L-threonylcarbamoyladenosine(37)-C(2))-methylthiotransferase MtaB [Candidatus Omnitrophota bacterium]